MLKKGSTSIEANEIIYNFKFIYLKFKKFNFKKHFLKKIS